MSDFFNSVLDEPGKLSKQFLGQNYRYQDHIKNPEEMGMSSEGTFNAIGNDIAGIVSYVELLVAGGGNATKNASGPLGDRFFLKTGGQCKDVQSGNKVDRYIYVDNVPDGTIPFISSGLGGYKFNTLKGIVPGIMTNIAHIEPTKIFSAFMMGANPLCMEVNRNVIDEDGNSSFSSHHMIRPDILSGENIDEINRFDNLANELKKKELKNNELKNKEGFNNQKKGNSNRGKSKKPYSARIPYGTILPYGPDRPYYPSEQPAYKSLYLEEKPHIPKVELPKYEMPVKIISDLKIDDNKCKDDIIYAPDITHKPEISTVPQIKEITIKNVNNQDLLNKKKDYSKIPDDILIKIYYSSLGLLGLYIFLKLLEKKN